MRINNVFSGRPAWYDRTPLDASIINVQAAIGPHVATTRWTYTVPSLRKAQMHSTYLHVHRVTVAAPVAPFGNRIEGPNGIYITARFNSNNAVDYEDDVNVGFSYLALAGAALLGRTFDLSTGGTVDYIESSSIVEFDA